MKAETRKKLEGFIRFSIEDPREAAEALALLCGIGGEKEKPKRDKLMTSKEAAEFAGVHRTTILLWGRLGYLNPRRITDRRIRFSRNELERFLEDGISAKAAMA